ncbi:MAG: cell division protein FtsA, partial [Proteobacteria bacterium]|nr:cell division protein FtsA [Pseudomonadota bacterium]
MLERSHHKVYSQEDVVPIRRKREGHNTTHIGGVSCGDIFALDLGTTKFCLATIQATEKHEKPMIQKAVVPSGGMRRGMICHMGEAQKALDRLMYLAEKEFARDIKQVYLGVAGSHLRSRIAHATLDLGGDTITKEDQLSLMKKCGRPIDQNYEVLHNIPIHYQVDSREFVDCATGFSGDFLKGSSFVIEADTNYLRDLIRLCNICGLKVKKLYAEPYASASVVVPYEQKRQGVVVVDIGGGTSDGIAFKDGKPVKMFTINVGGQIISQDLATCLRISPEDAHQIKHYFGLNYIADRSDKQADSGVTVCQRSGRQVTVTAEHVYKILSCRVSELYELTKQQLGDMAGLLHSGLILTGGGSELASLNQFLAWEKSVYVSQQKPSLPKLTNQTSHPDNRLSESSPYATVCGLLYLAWLDVQKAPPVTQKASNQDRKS